MWRAVLLMASAASLWSASWAKGDWPLCNGIIDTPGITQPAGDIALLAHDNLTITCLLNPDVVRNIGANASGLTFYRNMDKVKPNDTHRLELVSERALRLHVLDVQPSESVYYCSLYLNHTKIGVCSNSVVVGTVPQNISNFSCESNNWANLTCTWKPDELNYISTNYSLQIMYEGRAGRKQPRLCPEIVYEEDFYKCTWTLESKPAYRQAVESFTFSLTGHNKFGSNSQQIPFNLYANLRPAPPVNLHLVNVSSYMATLQWFIHHEIYHFPKTFIHKLMYCSELDETLTWKEILINAALEQQNITYNLSLPYANTRYDVRVYIKTEIARDTMWSNFSAIWFKTMSTLPARPPAVNIGSFDSLIVGSKRKVYMYWQQIERYEENGDDFTYKLVYAQTDTEQITLKPTHVTKSYMIFDEFTLDRVKLHIKSYNSMGYSNGESVMIIPDSKEILPKPSEFTKIEYEQGVYELSWSRVTHPDLESYTIFWCNNNRDIFRCENKVQWETVPADTTAKNITVNSNSPYQFAISANSKNSSSGMVWAQCTIVYQKSISKISNVWVNRVGDTYIEIDWKIECSDRIGVIQGFTIEYCPVYSLYNKVCKEEKKTIEVMKLPSSYKIMNLTPITLYSIQVAIKTKHGVGIMSDPIFNNTNEGKPTPPINVTISHIEDNRMLVSWKPPLTPNGHLRNYDIYYDSINDIRNVSVEPSNSINNSNGEIIMEHMLTNLMSYTNYTIRVSACTGFGCSEPSKTVKIRTAISKPGKVEHLNVVSINSSMNVRLTWSAPLHRGGDIDYYDVKITKVINDYSNESEIFNSTTNNYDVPSSVCLKEGINGVYLYVRAVNIDNRSDHGILAIEGSESIFISKRPDKEFNSVKFEGPWSSDKYNICIQNTENYYYLFYIVFGIVFLFGAVYGIRYLWIHFQNMQNIKPCLPAGLGNLEKEPVEKKPLNAQWNRLDIDKMNRLNSEYSLDRGINTGDFSNGIITDNCNDSENTDSTCVPSLASSNHSTSDGNKDGHEAHDGQSETVSANSSPRSRNIGFSSSRPDSAASANSFDQNSHPGNDIMLPYTTIGAGIDFPIQPQISENPNTNGYVSVGTLTNGKLFNPGKPSNIVDNLPYVTFQPNGLLDNVMPCVPKPDVSSGYVPNGTTDIFAPITNMPSEKTNPTNSLIHIINPPTLDKDYNFEDESIFDKLPNESIAAPNKPVMINGYVKRNEPDFLNDDACFQKTFCRAPAQIVPKQNTVTNIVVPVDNTAATEDAVSPEAYCRFGPNINVPQQFEFPRSDEDSEDILLSSLKNPDEFEYEKHLLLEKTQHSDPSVPSSHYVPINLQNVKP